MNLDAHILRLHQIQEKMDRGEELDELEVAYVRALWRLLLPVLRKFAEGVAQAMGTTIAGAAVRLELDARVHQRKRIAEEAMRRQQWRSL